jgi:hypothetical protein
MGSRRWRWGLGWDGGWDGVVHRRGDCGADEEMRGGRRGGSAGESNRLGGLLLVPMNHPDLGLGSPYRERLGWSLALPGTREWLRWSVALPRTAPRENPTGSGGLLLVPMNHPDLGLGSLAASPNRWAEGL